MTMRAACSLDIGARDDVLGLANVVGEGHPWFRKPQAESGVLLTIPDGAVTSMRSGLILVILSLAMASVLGGEVFDNCGCIGSDRSAFSAEEAIQRLVATNGVSGGIDELLLTFRYRHF